MSSLMLWPWSQCIAAGREELKAAAAFPWQPGNHSQQLQGQAWRPAAKSHQRTTQNQPEPCLAFQAL